MGTKHFYIGIAVIAIALIGGMALHAYISNAVDRARADQVKQDLKPVHEEAQQEKTSAQKAEDVNQKALLATLAAIATQKQQPVQPVDYERIDAMIAARMGVKSETKVDPNLPDAPSTTLPTKNLRDYMLDCDAANVSLTSCRDTVKHAQDELKAEQKDHAATKAELEAARKAMNGGGFLTRLRRNAKWFVIGGGVGAAAGYAASR
jgi:hypothetical protein